MHMLNESTKKRLSELAGIKNEQVPTEMQNDKNNDEPEGASYLVKINNIIETATHIKSLFKIDEDLPSWIQDKITLSEHNMSAIQDYYKGLNL